MNQNDHHPPRELIGAYLLDQLDTDDAERFRAHLRTCGVCRAEIDDLMPVVEALRDADPERVGTLPEPPPELGERIVAGLARQPSRQPRRPVIRTVLAAAAAAVLAVAVVLGLDRFGAPPLESVPVTVLAEPAQVEANLIAHEWGTELRLTGSGFRDGLLYRVMFESTIDGGGVTGAGTFLGTGDEPLVCNLTVGILRPDVAGILVTTASGEPVLRATLV